VKLSLNKQQKNSKVVKKTLNPTWDQVIEFKGVLRDLLAKPLELHCFDEDRAYHKTLAALRRDDLQGELQGAASVVTGEGNRCVNGQGIESGRSPIW
jgi:hypothetical protein